MVGCYKNSSLLRALHGGCSPFLHKLAGWALSRLIVLESWAFVLAQGLLAPNDFSGNDSQCRCMSQRNLGTMVKFSTGRNRLTTDSAMMG